MWYEAVPGRRRVRGCGSGRPRWAQGPNRFSKMVVPYKIEQMFVILKIMIIEFQEKPYIRIFLIENISINL